MPTKAIKHRLQDKYAKWAIVTLLVLGVLGITSRLLFSDQLQLPYGDTAWTISIEAKISGAKKDDKISISPPWNLSHIRLVSQKLQYTDMRIVRIKGDNTFKRDIKLKVTNPGDLTFYGEFDVHLSATPIINFIPPVTMLSTEDRIFYLSSEDKINHTSYEVTQVLKRLSKASSDKNDLVKRIFKYVQNNLVKDINNLNDSAEIALQTKTASTSGRCRAMVALSRATGIPARIVTGFILQEEIDATPHYWVELYDDNDSQWVSYDPEKGYITTLPSNYLAFSRGADSVIRSKDIENIQVTFSTEQNHDLASLHILKEKRIWDILDLERFPPDARRNISLLLLLPLGILITAFSRTIIGIRGYGTFTPTLLALAAVYSDWIAALVLLLIVVALGLSGRSAMPDKLTRIPRLAIMFTIVVMSMIIGVSLMDYFNVKPGEHAVLLPIVILTSLIDSFYRAAEDSGATIAIRRMVWTVIISIFCFPVLKLETLGGLLLTYPETHFVTLSLILTISLYTGKKVYEYPLFKWLKEPVNTKAVSKKTNKPSDI